MPGGVGLVGAGRIAQLHAAALRELGVPLVGVVASTPARSAEGAHLLGADRAFDDLDALLNEPRVEAVHIATPSGKHHEQAERALRAGKHVVCEKPLTTSAADSARLVRLAHDTGLVGAVAYTYRFHPGVRDLRERAAALGRLLLVRASYLQAWLLDAGTEEWRLDPAQNGASRALADLGSHAVDLIEFVTGNRVHAVSATMREFVPTSTVIPTAGDDIVVIAFELEGGGIGSLQLSQVAIGHSNSLTLEVNGERGAMAMDLRDTTRIWWATRGDEPSHLPVGAYGTDEDYVAAYMSFLEATQRAMAGESVADLPTFQDCLRTHAVRDTILRSASERAWAAVPAHDEHEAVPSTEPRVELAAGVRK
ncbi:Gfo/Idh/MocA family oxidoreductase [Microbacterium sp. EYE_5]|uniref:Gfo/Idh/MocA family protein n=1 Tax=unclassified Microbacterium TaxID=2609290 RepID=UPI0020038890|nr:MULTISPECIES: Gfo/Idh/MocA family oxidoreductase [unclassified Microbacterium]MCK6079395.1 Gfo/Idh/MocA family oxidoreductase [Microbacterium sp. EYE_382]MCK6084665.1 Gfo/Idh/MocA family oxidoreductase [Microbacterium sp. EYE_384]MCK6123106.1 Gfo/Idh/MocA family oxidoreductase [Microbacterium sp. EYE_80]MCK6125429.1 Gfo/Idh/MocA family oxidoreductase [Microbacterium sp. EYE_79]MCK6140349.1 Gfo/Idh/MocA family oxidoreductase [Microbacterium sp. EYE_39]